MSASFHIIKCLTILIVHFLLNLVSCVKLVYVINYSKCKCDFKYIIMWNIVHILPWFFVNLNTHTHTIQDPCNYVLKIPFVQLYIITSLSLMLIIRLSKFWHCFNLKSNYPDINLFYVFSACYESNYTV